jgi:hypothetical protein
MPLTRSETVRLLIDIVEDVRGLAAPRQESWTVCVLDESRQVVGSFSMTSFAHVSELQRRLAEHGYRMKVLDPDKHHCDFVLQPAGDAADADDLLR